MGAGVIMESDVRISVVREYAEIAEIAALADEVWHEHYGGLLSKGQIDYMVGLFQSEKAIAKSIAENHYTYYAIRDVGLLVGYCGVQPNEEDHTLFLSKLYLRADYRGRRISRLVLAMLYERCITEGYNSIWLTVNKGNTNSIDAYRKLGFSIEREEVTDIGNGYVMDDYIMRCPVRATH